MESAICTDGLQMTEEASTTLALVTLDETVLSIFAGNRVRIKK